MSTSSPRCWWRGASLPPLVGCWDGGLLPTPGASWLLGLASGGISWPPFAMPAGTLPGAG
eukprot:14268203-Heterocapsa_arctica.AAC.1